MVILCAFILLPYRSTKSLKSSYRYGVLRFFRICQSSVICHTWNGYWCRSSQHWYQQLPVWFRWQRLTLMITHASYQIRKNADCACARNAGNVSLSPRGSDPDIHHGTCVTHVPWCMAGSLTSGFLWNRWQGKRSRHSWRMRNPQFYVSGKRPIPTNLVEGRPIPTSLVEVEALAWICAPSAVLNQCLIILQKYRKGLYSWPTFQMRLHHTWHRLIKSQDNCYCKQITMRALSWINVLYCFPNCGRRVGLTKGNHCIMAINQWKIAKNTYVRQLIRDAFI